jgi:hypothetical protein
MNKSLYEEVASEEHQVWREQQRNGWGKKR